MSTETPAAPAPKPASPTPKWMVWTGWIITLLPVAVLVLSGIAKFIRPPELEKGFEHLQWDSDLAFGLGILELTCVAFYLLPRTAVLGAILITGYFGGVIATHVRIGDNFGENVVPPFIFGVLTWLGLVLRDARLRALLPVRTEFGKMWLLTRIFFILLTAAVGLVIFIALQPAKFHVERSISIAAPPGAVFDEVDSFRKWQHWSPWAKLDRNAVNTFEGEWRGKGASFQWSGNDNVGEGSMLITESRPGELIRIHLEFVRPMAGSNVVEFTFKPEGKKTVVTWSMTGRSNFVGKAFQLIVNMDKMVGDKFNEGLTSMKEISEAKMRPKDN